MNLLVRIAILVILTSKLIIKYKVFYYVLCGGITEYGRCTKSEEKHIKILFLIDPSLKGQITGFPAFRICH